jgi:uncharacterized membrane protein
VKGVVKMHDFRARPFSRGLRLIDQTAQPLFNASSAAHYLGPADFSIIYNIHGLYTSGLNGAGQSIAVIGRSNIQLSDIASFRAHFGLPSNTPSVIVAQGADPGFTADGDAVEATLDVQWAGAIAPRAAVKLVFAASTTASDGVDLAALYAVNHNVAPVLSVSFGSCEADMGTTELAFYNSLWQQAASQGISVFVSAGDSGAAGCDPASSTTGTTRAVNGICSSPFATCVGGTQFNEGANPGMYWLPGNNPTLGTAQSYIPELVWNESAANGGSELFAGAGGASIQWPKPNWQIGNGVPADGHRDVPDVALSAAAHDGYLIFFNGALSVVSGTSASSPSLASLFTIINQKYNGAQGNINPVLYPLAIKQAQGGAAVFHDIVSGNNSVPGVAGYAAGLGYDLASGLGSIDGQQLVNHWRDASLNGGFTVTVPAAVTVQAGQNATVPATVSVNGGFNWPVTLSVSGVPTGVNATFSQPLLPAPGSGTSLLQFAANFTAAGGAYNVTVTATSGGYVSTTSIILTVNALTLNCSLMTDPSKVSLPIGQASNVRVTCPAPQGKLPASLALAVSGQPSGVTASFSQPALTPGTGVSALTIIAGNSAAAGSYTLAITAANGAFSKTINLPLTLATPPGFAITAANTSLSLNQGAAAQVQVVVAHTGSFNSPVTLGLSGLPLGITGTFAPAQFSAPGDGTSLLTLQTAGYTPPGKYTIAVVGVGGSLRNTLPLVVTVNSAPTFDFAADLAAPAVYAGQPPGQVNLTVKNLTGNFNSAVALSAIGLPSDVTTAFAPATLAAPGSGTSVLSLTAATVATPGQYRFTVLATGGGVVRYANLLLTVIGQPSFTLKTDVTALALVSGATFNTLVRLAPQNGFNAPVSLTAGTLPAGISVTFSSNTITSANGGVTMMVQTASSLPAANYSIAVMGTSSAPVAASTAAIALSIGSFQVSLGSPALSVARGGSVTTQITETVTNYTGNVFLSVTGLPGGGDYTLSPPTLLGSGTSTLTISPHPGVTPGIYTVTLRTAAGGTVIFTPLLLTVN